MFTLDQELTKRMSKFKTLEDFRMQARTLVNLAIFVDFWVSS